MNRQDFVMNYYEEELKKKTRDYATLLSMYSELQQEVKQLKEQLDQANTETAQEE